MRLLASFLIFTISLTSYAVDSGQTVPGQIQESIYDNMEVEEEKSKYSLDNIDSKKDITRYFLPLDDSENEKYMGKKDADNLHSLDLMSKETESTEYHTFSEKEAYVKVQNKGKSDFMFSYMKDTFDYVDADGTFDATFGDADGAENSFRGGLAYFSINRYVMRKALLNLKLGLNFGIGYNQGKGVFANGGRGRAQIILWSLPVDFNMGAEINLTRFMKLQLSGGPSAMGLIQVRSDRIEADSRKRIRQMGYGYFYSAGLKFSLSDIFYSSIGFKSLAMYDMSKMSIDVFMRGQNLSGFKSDDVEIKGTSFGLGFSFEFL